MPDHVWQNHAWKNHIWRAFVLRATYRSRGPAYESCPAGITGGITSTDARFQECIDLASAVQRVTVVGSKNIRLTRINPASFIGKGQVSELQEILDELEANLLVFDGSLTPIQQRNLERMLDVKVLERTALILEIFKERAWTHVGQLQVDIVALHYQRTRLVRSWTHLERQRGGLSFIGGPGESQLEIDRRLIVERLDKLQAKLAKIDQNHALARRARKDFIHIALAGYTNAGKSSLLNRLAKAKLKASNQLFATLDPSARVTIIDGIECMIADTVGFISDLPEILIPVFKTTLEEIAHADLVLHVRDVTDPHHGQKAKAVRVILDELLDKHHSNGHGVRILDVFTKADHLDRDAHAIWQGRHMDGVLVSAKTGAGCEQLQQKIATELALSQLVDIRLAMADHHSSAIVEWLAKRARILDSTVEPDSGQFDSGQSETIQPESEHQPERQIDQWLHLRVAMPSLQLQRFRSHFPDIPYQLIAR